MTLLSSRSTHLPLEAINPNPDSFATAAVDGRLRFGIALQNRSAVPAQHPFFCLMDLGLSVETHGDWQLDRIVSDGRRLLRCSYQGDRPMLAGERTVAASLVLHVSLAGGGLATFGQAPVAPAAHLKDLRLFAITGAANFPADRCQLVIATEQVRNWLATVEESAVTRMAV